MQTLYSTSFFIHANCTFIPNSCTFHSHRELVNSGEIEQKTATDKTQFKFVVPTNFQMSAAIVTHLMILLQFQVSENYKVDKKFYKKITGIYGTNGNDDVNSEDMRTWFTITTTATTKIDRNNIRSVIFFCDVNRMFGKTTVPTRSDLQRVKGVEMAINIQRFIVMLYLRL